MSDLFLLNWIRWYAYCLECGGEAENSAIALSEDDFHDQIPAKNRFLLKALPRYSDIKENDFVSNSSLIASGRAKENMQDLLDSGFGFRDQRYIAKSCECDTYQGNVYLQDMIYLSADGNICLDCDLSYKEQKEYSIGVLKIYLHSSKQLKKLQKKENL